MTDIVLKPCRFCGGSVRMEPVTDEMYLRYYIRCNECSARTEFSLLVSSTEEKTAEAWNKSATEKHGKWKDGQRSQECSVCKGWGLDSFDFCPHCGAEMDKVGSI